MRRGRQVRLLGLGCAIRPQTRSGVPPGSRMPAPKRSCTLPCFGILKRLSVQHGVWFVVLTYARSTHGGGWPARVKRGRQHCLRPAFYGACTSAKVCTREARVCEKGAAAMRLVNGRIAPARWRIGQRVREGSKHALWPGRLCGFYLIFRCCCFLVFEVNCYLPLPPPPRSFLGVTHMSVAISIWLKKGPLHV